MKNETAELLPVTETPDIDTMKRADTLAIFEDYKAQAIKLKATAETLTVTNIGQLAEMKLARTVRLSFKELRVSGEKRRKELVEASLREQQQINGDWKKIKDMIEPLEERLLEQEQFIERETIRIEDEKRNTRQAEIAPYLTAPLAIDLGKYPDADYANLLRDMKDAHNARLERERKEKEAEQARIKAEAEERERIRLENEGLKKEAFEREAAAKKEREELEAKAKAEREAAAAQLEKERNAAKAKADEEAAKAKKEREEIEAKARAEREAAEKAALAPDKEKLAAIAGTVRAIVLPAFATVKGRHVAAEISEQQEKFAKWIEKKGVEL